MEGDDWLFVLFCFFGAFWVAFFMVEDIMGRGAFFGRIVWPFWDLIKFPLLYLTIILVVSFTTYKIITKVLEKRRRRISEEYWALKEAEEKRRKLEEEKIEARKLAEKRRKEEEQKLEELREKELFEEDVNEVLDFFMKNKSKDYVGFDHRYYDEDVIEEARKRYDKHWAVEYEYKKREAQEFELKKKCFLFVLHHDYLPYDLFRKDGSLAESFIDEAIELKEEGKLKEYISQYFNVPCEQDYKVVGGEEKARKLVKSAFYLLKDLKDEEILFLKKFHGYKEVPVSIFGETFEKGIVKSAANESDNHIILKHLFGKLHKNAVVEHSITRNVQSPVFVDVAFFLDKTKIAVEIERGTNKLDYFKEKIKVLERFFDKIIIVVTRHKKSRYKVFNDGKKVFVMTPKDAKRQLRKWIKVSRLAAPRKTLQNLEKREEIKEIETS